MTVLSRTSPTARPWGHNLDFYRRIPNTLAPYGQALIMLLLVEMLAKNRSRAADRAEAAT